MAWEENDGIIRICRIGGLLRGACTIASASGWIESCDTLTQPRAVAAYVPPVTVTGWRDYS
jgi:hypothetical protein